MNENFKIDYMIESEKHITNENLNIYEHLRVDYIIESENYIIFESQNTNEIFLNEIFVDYEKNIQRTELFYMKVISYFENTMEMVLYTMIIEMSYMIDFS